MKLFNKPFIARIHPTGNGIQRLYKYPNGYGASVVRFKLKSNEMYGSYTDNEEEWELAVIKWNKDDYSLDYDTEVTDDVEGHLTKADVEKLLIRIKELS